MQITSQAARLDGKVAVVTGGTQGLGETVARTFAARGAAGLVICGRNTENGRRVAADISRAGCRTEFVKADMENLSEARAVMGAADKAFGRVDVLVNGAGITNRGTIFETSPELFDRIIAVNLRAPFFLIQDAVTIMRREKTEGCIVNIQSIAGNGGPPFLAPYAVSKGGLATLTKNAAFALMRHRIRVNGLNIGRMKTPNQDIVMKEAHGAADDWIEQAEAVQPFGRLIETVEAARAVTFLASDESGMMTGVNIDFDQTVTGAWETAPHPSETQWRMPAR